jgi:hypothetical protein
MKLMKERIATLDGVPAPMLDGKFGTKATEDALRFVAIIWERKIVGGIQLHDKRRVVMQPWRLQMFRIGLHSSICSAPDALFTFD